MKAVHLAIVAVIGAFSGIGVAIVSKYIERPGTSVLLAVAAFLPRSSSPCRVLSRLGCGLYDTGERESPTRITGILSGSYWPYAMGGGDDRAWKSYSLRVGYLWLGWDAKNGQIPNLEILWPLRTTTSMISIWAWSSEDLALLHLSRPVASEA